MNKRSRVPVFLFLSLSLAFSIAIQHEGVAHGVAMQTYSTDAPVCYASRHMRRDFNTNSGGLHGT